MARKIHWSKTKQKFTSRENYQSPSEGEASVHCADWIRELAPQALLVTKPGLSFRCDPDGHQ